MTKTTRNSKQKKMVIVMVNEKLIQRIQDNGYENSDEDFILLIDDRAFCDSVVGISDDNRAVYDYEKMAEELAKTYGMSIEDAYDHIEFNILRSLPYFGPTAPIVFNPLQEV